MFIILLSVKNAHGVLSCLSTLDISINQILKIAQMLPQTADTLLTLCLLPSWMWPYTWYLGLTLVWTLCNRSTQPARIPVLQRSPKPSGGPWVMRTSVSSGIRFHFLRHSSPRLRLNAQPPNSGCHGEPWSGLVFISREFKKCAAHYRDKYYPGPKYF